MDDEINSNMVTESPPPLPIPPSQQLIELIQSLELATQLAKQLPTTSDSNHLRLIYSSLTSAHLSLSSFLSIHSTTTAVTAAVYGGDDPMMVADGGGGSEEVERVEEKMREFLYIQNKRPKRALSPTAAAVVERVGFEDRVEFDPVETMLRNLDLVYQFHA